MLEEPIPNDVCGEATFVTYVGEIESKGVQFPAAEIRGRQSAVARDSSKTSALVPQEHQIRMCSDERENTRAKTVVQSIKFYFCYVQFKFYGNTMLSILRYLK